MLRTAALLIGFWAAGLIHAQSADALTVSGTVLELGSDGSASLPVAGVEVSLIEFVQVDGAVTRSPAATAYTDSRGAYQFHPVHPGGYYVEVKKDGYRYAAQGFYGASVKLDQAHPAARSTFTLSRRGGSITGRVVDEDGQPVADLRVVVQPPVFGPQEAAVVTAADGTFTTADLSPGPHVVRISSQARELEKAEPHFSAADLKVVDRDFETSYWPGGSTQPTGSIPLGPGAGASVGTIQIRKVPYYRVHVSVTPVKCDPGEKWTFSAVPSSQLSLGGRRVLPCTSDFLVSNLRPGTYSFALRRDPPALGRWALALVDISDKNSEVSLSLEPEAQINGRLIAVEGAALPPLNNIRVSARAEVGPTATQPASPDAEGKFILKNLEFPRHRIVIEGLTPQYYVKEIRFNGALLPDATATVGPGTANQMEIAIDDKPGAIAGTVTDGDKPAAGATVRLYPKIPPLTRFVGAARTDQQGRFQINGLAPGEYQVLATPASTGRVATGYAEAATKLAASAPSVTVERGGTVAVTVPLSDPRIRYNAHRQYQAVIAREPSANLTKANRPLPARSPTIYETIYNMERDRFHNA